MLDIKVYIALRDSIVTRQDLRKEKRFHRPDLGLFCARTGALQRHSGLVNRLHTTEHGGKAPESKYNHHDSGSAYRAPTTPIPGTAPPGAQILRTDLVC